MRDERDRRCLLQLAPVDRRKATSRDAVPSGTSRLGHHDPSRGSRRSAATISAVWTARTSGLVTISENSTPRRASARPSRRASLAAARGERTGFVSGRVVAGLRVPDQRDTHGAEGRLGRLVSRRRVRRRATRR